MDGIVRKDRYMAVGEASRPAFPRHTKFRFDTTRDRWVLLVPERVLAPDDIAVEILQLVDGVRTVTDIVAVLAEKYAADSSEILGDVVVMLQDLADKGFLVEAEEKRL